MSCFFMDFDKAKDILNESLLNINLVKLNILTDSHKNDINEILLGDHLTFRYILFTALLAKNTDPKIHMRSIQAGANLKGAYDARSLCHKVIVPFEKGILEGRLGNSNEPFLNKPARFPAVDPSNAVRAGSDRLILKRLSELLESLNDSDENYNKEAFLFAVSVILKRESKSVLSIKLPKIKSSQLNLGNIIDKFLSLPCEGQNAVAVIGAILKKIHNEEKKVFVHPPNQAGSSSRGIGDIDVLLKNKLVYAVEVKDKKFTETDVMHAIENVISSGNSKLVFALGVAANCHLDTEGLVLKAEQKGFDLSFIDIKSLAKHLISIIDAHEREVLFREIYQILIEMRAKDIVVKTFKSLLNLQLS